MHPLALTIANTLGFVVLLILSKQLPLQWMQPIPEDWRPWLAVILPCGIYAALLYYLFQAIARRRLRISIASRNA